MEFIKQKCLSGDTWVIPTIRIQRFYPLTFDLKIQGKIFSAIKSFGSKQVLVSALESLRPRFPFKAPLAKTSIPLAGNSIKGKLILNKLSAIRVLFYAPFRSGGLPADGVKLWEGIVRPLDDSYGKLKAICGSNNMVVGVVRSQSNAPIIGARVKLFFGPGRNKWKIGYTNENGVFVAYVSDAKIRGITGLATFGEFMSKSTRFLQSEIPTLKIDLSKAASVIVCDEFGEKILKYTLTPGPQAIIGKTIPIRLFPRPDGVQILKTAVVPKGCRWFLSTERGQCQVKFPEKVTWRNSPYRISFLGDEATCSLTVLFQKGRVGVGSHLILRSMGPKFPGSWPLEYLFVFSANGPLRCPNLMPGKYKVSLINNFSRVQSNESFQISLTPNSENTIRL